MPDRALREGSRANEQRLSAIEEELRQLRRRASPGTAIIHSGSWGPTNGKIIPPGRWIVLARAGWAYREAAVGGEMRMRVEAWDRDGVDLHPLAVNDVVEGRKEMMILPALTTGGFPEIQDETQVSGEIISPTEWRVVLQLRYFTPPSEPPPVYVGAWGARVILLPY